MTCQARGCIAPASPQIMCGTHWPKVPLSIQRDVEAEKAGATDAAIGFVAMKEGKSIRYLVPEKVRKYIIDHNLYK